MCLKSVVKELKSYVAAMKWLAGEAVRAVAQRGVQLASEKLAKSRDAARNP